MKRIFFVLMLWICLTGSAFAAVELDADSNGAVDTDKGGLNTTDGSGVFSGATINATYGTNKTINPTFTTDYTGWSKQSDWGWESPGRMRHTTTSGSGYFAASGVSEPVPGKVYKITFTIGGSTTGSVYVGIGAINSVAFSGNGTYTTYIKAYLGSAFGVSANPGFDGYIDDVYYYEASSGGNVDVDGKLTIRDAILLMPGTELFPSITLNSYRNTGFYQYSDSVAYSQGGTKQIQFTAEDSTAGMIRGFGSNRFTIEAWNALVLRALSNHFEIEGAANSTGIEIVPYRAGSSQGIPLTFKTDPTLPATFIIKVDGNFSQKPAASVTPEDNGELAFEATSNTSVTVKLKGSDGTVRSAVLTMAP